MIRRSAIACALSLCLVALSACEKQPYAARVNGSVITAQQLHDYIDVFTVVSTDAASYKVNGTTSVAQQLAGYSLSQLATARLIEQFLKKNQGVNTRDRAIERAAELFSSATAAAQWQKFSPEKRKVFAEVLVASYVYGALDAGVKPSDATDVVCAEIGQFGDKKSANAAVEQISAGVQLSQLVLVTNTCFAVRGKITDPTVVAIANAKANDVVGPIEASVNAQSAFNVARITSRSHLPFRDWPLSALANLSGGTGALAGQVRKSVDVVVNPAFGRVPVGPEAASCGQVLVCIVPPVDPTQKPDQQQIQL